MRGAAQGRGFTAMNVLGNFEMMVVEGGCNYDLPKAGRTRCSILRSEDAT